MRNQVVKKISERAIFHLIMMIVVILTVIILTSIPRDLDFEYMEGKLICNIPFQVIKENIFHSVSCLLKGEAFQVMISGRGQPIWKLMKYAFLRSFTLFFASLFFSLILGIPKGILDSRRDKKQWTFKLLQTLIPLSIPDVLMISAVQLFGAVLYRNGISFLGTGPIMYIGYDSWSQSIYPVIALSLVPAAYIARLTASVIETVYDKEYILAARGKGCSEFQIIRIHTIRNVMMEIVAALPAVTSIIFSSLFIVERIFYYPGIAYHMMDFYMNPGREMESTMMAFTTFAVVLSVVYYIFFAAVTIVKQVTLPRIKDHLEG